MAEATEKIIKVAEITDISAGHGEKIRKILEEAGYITAYDPKYDNILILNKRFM